MSSLADREGAPRWRPCPMCPLCQPPAAVVPPRVSPVQPVSFVGTFVRAFLVGLLAPWAALILGALLAG